MDFSRCQPPCSHRIASVDQHGKCVKCVGLANAGDAIFGISNCKYCENFTLKTLRARLAVFDRESAVLHHRAAPEATSLREATAWSSDVELEAMESEQFSLSLPPSPGRHSVNSPVQFSRGCLAPSPEARDAVSFGLEDILYTAASNSEDFGAASLDALPPSGQEARPSPAYTELMDVLARATEKLSLDWPDEPRESQSSKLDERFLSGSGSRPARKKLPFFPDLHHEISRSWRQPFSSRLTNAAAADFTNLVGSVEQGYAAVPAIEDTLATHLSPTSAPSWKFRPLLPSKPCRTTSALIDKSYMAAGQAGAALHTMAILQAYQAEVLKEMDEGDEGMDESPEAVKELRRATDLALRATKHTARAVGRSMAGLVAAERHLWLNLTEIREKEKAFLLDAPISSSGLFGDAVNTVVDKFRAAKTQSAAFKQFMPRRAREPASASSSRERPAPRKEPVGRVSDLVHPPPYTVWGACGRSDARQCPRKRVDLKHPSSGRS